MRETTKQIGDVGEAVAKRFLESNGFIVIDENFQRPVGEIDIIAQGDKLVFVEVKTVRCRIPDELPQDGEDNHRPEEQVNDEKCRRLRRIIEVYLESEGVEGEWRVDLLCVYLDEWRDEARVKWLKNIII